MNDFTYLKDIDFKEGRYYIGASDIPTLALLNLRFGGTPLKLYNVIKGLEPPWEGNERTKIGKEIEPMILKWGLEKMGYDCDYTKFLISRLKEKRKYKHLHSFTEASCPGMPYLKAHTDLIEVNEPFGMEAKSTGFFAAKRGDDPNMGYSEDDLSENGIPAGVYLQVQAQMLCYGMDTWYVPVQIDTGITRLYGPISASVKTQEKIMALAERFQWHLENDSPPKPESWEDVQSMFPEFKKETQSVISGIAMEKALEMKDRVKVVRKKIKKLNEEKDDIKNAMGLFIEDKKYLVTDEGQPIASRSKYPIWNLSNYKNMDEERRAELERDGFVKKSFVDKLNY